MAFDSAGNLYVANSGADTVSEVTPTAAVSTYVSGVDDPVGLAFDSAGDLDVADAVSNAVSQVAEGVSVPFTLGGDRARGRRRRHGQSAEVPDRADNRGHHRHAGRP